MYRIFFLLFFVLPLQAQDEFTPLENVASLQAELKAHSAELKSIQSQFSQTKHLDFMEEQILSSGDFYFQKENQLRWEYKVPFQYLIVINQEQIAIKDDMKTNRFDASSNKLFKEINRMMMKTMTGDVFSDKETFDYTISENANLYKVSLVPKDRKMKQFMLSMELLLDKTNYLVNQITMFESGGDYTLIKFEDRKINEELPNALFILE